jgi:hypothetical protein
LPHVKTAWLVLLWVPLWRAHWWIWQSLNSTRAWPSVWKSDIRSRDVDDSRRWVGGGGVQTTAGPCPFLTAAAHFPLRCLLICLGPKCRLLWQLQTSRIRDGNKLANAKVHDHLLTTSELPCTNLGENFQSY